MMRPGSLGSTMTPTTSASSPSPVLDQPTMRERLSEPSGSLKTAFQPGSAGTSCAIRMAGSYAARRTAACRATDTPPARGSRPRARYADAMPRSDGKYIAYPYGVDLPDRTWPSRRLDRAPIWCSVDRRDGNQALIDPMDVARKRLFFELLVRLGYKEIEVGFPSASQPDWDFSRLLIEEELIADDVTIEVLTRAREELIRKTVESLRGAPRAILHLYNSTSVAQRRWVFRLERDGVVELAVENAKRCRDAVELLLPDSEVTFQYSPESFTSTEMDFALEICDAVFEV